MRIFLDSSVALAASMSGTGASREVFRLAAGQGWHLLVSPWVLRETRDNLANKSPQAVRTWIALRTLLRVEDDELTFDWPITFETAKDKPVLFTALACADVLLTLDRRDFRDLLGKTIYGLRVLTPGEFLRTEREAGQLP
ncbi:MAG: PIN domain-containing protein [Verrucomicrobia bacterium]|nr:PIN domain-containing protein [Verrucomicrobiota bacterium]